MGSQGASKRFVPHQRACELPGRATVSGPQPRKSPVFRTYLRDDANTLLSKNGIVTLRGITGIIGLRHEELLGKELWEIGLLKDENASREAFRELRGRHFIRYEDCRFKPKRASAAK